jgi:hypothetical protein
VGGGREKKVSMEDRSARGRSVCRWYVRTAEPEKKGKTPPRITVHTHRAIDGMINSYNWRKNPAFHYFDIASRSVRPTDTPKKCVSSRNVISRLIRWIKSTSCRIPTAPHQNKSRSSSSCILIIIQHLIPIEFEKAFNERKLNYILYLRIS